MNAPLALRLVGVALLLLAPPALHAQFGGLKKLTQGLDKATQTIDKAKDTAAPIADRAKDVGKIAKGLAGIGPEEERDIGGSVSQEIVSRYGGLVRDEAVTRRVNLMGKSLARYGKRPELDWRFGVLASDTVNAFSAPGGRVFITRGLYDTLTTDDMLAAVLAHEITHIDRRHALKSVERNELFSGATSLASSQSSDLRAAENLARQFDLGVDQIINKLLDAGLDPAQEYEADKDGRALAVLTGYAPGGLRAVLVQLQERKADSKKIFSSHPPLAERVKKLPKE